MKNQNISSIIKHVAVAGNIGAGKTTLTTALSKHYNWEPHYESADNNPYLNDFYNNMDRWSFNLQIYFLHNRYQQVLKIHAGDHTVIQDRTIYEDAHIFAPNLHDMGLMTARDFNNYFELFKTMSGQINLPDLLIYLRMSVPNLVAHIQQRGRDYEGSISLDYLKNLNDRYENWISNYEGKILIIEGDKLDFVNEKEHLGEIINRIDAEINGLF
jgi:deoxyadenosine/deoxycytidine kinase